MKILIQASPKMSIFFPILFRDKTAFIWLNLALLKNSYEQKHQSFYKIVKDMNGYKNMKLVWKNLSNFTMTILLSSKTAKNRQFLLLLDSLMFLLQMISKLIIMTLCNNFLMDVWDFLNKSEIIPNLIF